MGFGMTFLAMRDGEQVDGDREGLRAFLAKRGLVTRPFSESLAHLESHDLYEAGGKRFLLDGSMTDLTVSPPDATKFISGHISHAHLGPEELAFIFDLCAAAGWFVINQQARGETPMCLFPTSGSHGPSDTWDQEVTWAEISNAEELGQALAGSFRSFVRFRDRVIGRSDSE